MEAHSPSACHPAQSTHIVSSYTLTYSLRRVTHLIATAGRYISSRSRRVPSPLPLLRSALSALPLRLPLRLRLHAAALPLGLAGRFRWGTHTGRGAGYSFECGRSVGDREERERETPISPSPYLSLPPCRLTLPARLIDQNDRNLVLFRIWVNHSIRNSNSPFNHSLLLFSFSPACSVTYQHIIRHIPLHSVRSFARSRNQTSSNNHRPTVCPVPD